jgi:hypothetical protein
MSEGTDITQFLNTNKHVDSPSAYLAVKMVQSRVCLNGLPLLSLSRNKK